MKLSMTVLLAGQILLSISARAHNGPTSLADTARAAMTAQTGTTKWREAATDEDLLLATLLAGDVVCASKSVGTILTFKPTRYLSIDGVCQKSGTDMIMHPLKIEMRPR